MFTVGRLQLTANLVFPQLNSKPEILQDENRGQDQAQLLESSNKKGKYLEGEPLEYGIQEKCFLKKSETSTESVALTSEKDAISKVKSMKGRQTQSGPLVPGVVLGHSKSERAGNFERFVLVPYQIFPDSFLSLSSNF